MTTSDYLIWSALITMFVVIFIGGSLSETDTAEEFETEATTPAVTATNQETEH